MKNGQQIIFKHPVSGKVYSGHLANGSVVYFGDNGIAHLPFQYIKEWVDSYDAFKAFALQIIRTGT